MSTSAFTQYVVGSDNPATGYFTYDFDFSIDEATLLVYVKEPDDDGFTLRTEDTDYTVDKSASRIAFLTSEFEPEDGSIVRIERSTTLERTNDYQGGTTLTAQALDTDADQIFYILQEIEADLDDALRLDRSGTYWDGEGTRSANCAEATTDDGWITLAQANALIVGGDVVHLDSAEPFKFTGDGSTRYFELSGYDSLTRTRVFVSINGVIQHSYDSTYYEVVNPDDSDYPDGYTASVVEFTNAPAYGDEIEVRLFKGTVTAQYGEGVIDSDALEDGILEFRHFDDLRASGSTAQRIIFNPSAEPTFEDVDDLSLFETALNTWLSGKALGDLSDTFINEALHMQSKKITNLALATNGGDAVSKQWITNNVGLGQIKNDKCDDLSASSWKTTATIGFAPDVVLGMLRFTISGQQWQSPIVFTRWQADNDDHYFMGGVHDPVGGPYHGPSIRVDLNDGRLRARLVSVGDASPNGIDLFLLAIKFS